MLLPNEVMNVLHMIQVGAAAAVMLSGVAALVFLSVESYAKWKRRQFNHGYRCGREYVVRIVYRRSMGVVDRGKADYLLTGFDEYNAIIEDYRDAMRTS